MNLNTKLRGQAAVLAVALGGTLALAGGCTTMSGDSMELQPTVYVAVAPLDLPEDYDAFPTLDYVPVAPLDLEDENVAQARPTARSTKSRWPATDDWMVP